ncbi:hypothetical protein PWT90_03286 [Aphanocladium album]|nr:hypothetical protein PWT90_03286 [Aphanocladium album]
MTGEEKYKKAAAVSKEQLNIYLRTPSTAFGHNGPYFPNQMWLDGIFMGDFFYTKWTHLFDSDNTTAWNDILTQFTLIDTHTRNSTSNLLVHGWADPAKAAKWADPETGKAPHVWGRAVGWYFMALMETLQVFPEPHPGRERLLDYFVKLAGGLQQAQDCKTGGWWQASGSVMFTDGLLKGIKLGYLDEDEFLDTAKSTYLGLVEQFIQVDDNCTVHYNGAVDQCELAVDDPSFELSSILTPDQPALLTQQQYYISVTTHTDDFTGSGPFMLAAYEWETWASKV